MTCEVRVTVRIQFRLCPGGGPRMLSQRSPSSVSSQAWLNGIGLRECQKMDHHCSSQTRSERTSLCWEM